MDVPDIMEKGILRLSESSSLGPIASVKAAMTFTPGAVISGLRIDGSIELGPLEENEAINGAGFVPNSVFTELIYAVGFLAYVRKQNELPKKSIKPKKKQ